MVRQTRSQTNKMNISHKILAWLEHGEGEEVMLLFSERCLFFTKEDASNVFTEAEIATLTLDARTALGFAWFAHTMKHKTKQEALVVALNYFGQKMHDLMMSIPEERRDAASDFIEADGHWKIVPNDDMD